MARIPEMELERLKAEISVERLVEASGIALTKTGKDLVGKCPFHEDREASLIVTPTKNLFHCFGCGTGGGPVDWVMKMQGLSFRHAVELLKSDHAMSGGPSAPVKESRVRVLPHSGRAPRAPRGRPRRGLPAEIRFLPRPREGRTRAGAEDRAPAQDPMSDATIEELKRSPR